jgi:hypothetical protein
MLQGVGEEMLALLTLALSSTPVYADGRDDRTLLPQHLVNRNLPGQLEEFRYGDELGPFSAAADVLLSSEVTLGKDTPAPFHGFFFTNAFFSLDIFEIADVNLNLLVLAMTASGGYRATNSVIPGFAAHLHLELFRLAGDPVLFDVLASDLDVVTLGEGLVRETTPLEGFLGGFRWNAFELRALFGGRVYWYGDDLFHVAFRAFDGLVGAGYTLWFRGYGGELDPFTPKAHYASLHGKWSPFDGGTIAGEYIARIGGPRTVAHAAMARGDYLQRFGDLALHAGYQFRWYQTGFGPIDQLWTPTTLPLTPLREDYYATSSFEILGLTPFFDQWSHTVMLEATFRLAMFEIFGELEWWLRFTSDVEKEPARPVYSAQGDLVPGVLNQIWYRAGVRLYPLDGLPHHLVAYFSNKSVFAQGSAINPTAERFLDVHGFFVEAEIRL